MCNIASYVSAAEAELLPYLAPLPELCAEFQNYTKFIFVSFFIVQKIIVSEKLTILALVGAVMQVLVPQVFH